MGRPRKDAFDESTTVRVLRAAERVFGDRGFARARLEDIAAEASIRRSSLLYHFGSKDKLYQQVVDKAFTEITAAMTRGMSQGETYAEKIEATTEELIAFQEKHAGLMAVVLRGLLDPNTAGHNEVGDKFAGIIDQLEAFVKVAGGTELPYGLPARAVLMQLVVTHLAHAAMGDLGERLWQGLPLTREVARALLIGGPTTSPE